MKRINIIKYILLIFLPFSVSGQIDYSKGLELISTENPHVNIIWIKDAPRRVPFFFNQQVVFVNTKEDKILASKVTVSLFHNTRLLKSFVFNTGDNNIGRIYLNDPVQLNQGDSIILKFQLRPVTENEEYVFNLFNKQKDKIEEPLVARTEPIIKEEKTKKNKYETTSTNLKRIRRNRTVLSIINVIAR